MVRIINIKVFSFRSASVTFLILASVFYMFNCRYIRERLISIYGDNYAVEGTLSGLRPVFSGKDRARKRIRIGLKKVFKASRPTDIQFPPGNSGIMFVLEKNGALRRYNLRNGKSNQLLRLKVITASEQGLLGLAFHPEFQRNGRFYLNYSLRRKGKDISRVSEWRMTFPAYPFSSRAGQERIIMEVVQPYSNHNAGQLAFGPDGMLYIGWGDGGWRADPGGHGQNPETLLGSMLRLNVNNRDGKPYSIPANNPFVKRPGFRPEIFAYGLRNPWRYSFDDKGRLIVADVGQDDLEELNIVEAGQNYGWNIMEGKRCFKPSKNCLRKNLTLPFYEYGRAEGQSITGGYVYTGQKIKKLRGKYLFGDFVSGRIWAIRLPETNETGLQEVEALGKWSLLISTFGRDNRGEMYIADYASGNIFQIISLKN